MKPPDREQAQRQDRDPRESACVGMSSRVFSLVEGQHPRSIHGMKLLALATLVCFPLFTSCKDKDRSRDSPAATTPPAAAKVEAPKADESAALPETKVPIIHGSNGAPMPAGYELTFEGPKGASLIPYTQVGIEVKQVGIEAKTGKLALRFAADGDKLGAPSVDATFDLSDVDIAAVGDLKGKTLTSIEMMVLNSGEVFQLIAVNATLVVEEASKDGVTGTLKAELVEEAGGAVVHQLDAKFRAFPNSGLDPEVIAVHRKAAGR